MENTLFIGDFPIETPISSGFPIATFDYRRVYLMLKLFYTPKWWHLPQTAGRAAAAVFRFRAAAQRPQRSPMVTAALAFEENHHGVF